MKWQRNANADAQMAIMIGPHHTHSRWAVKFMLGTGRPPRCRIAMSRLFVTECVLGGQSSRPPDHPAGWMRAGASLIERLDRGVVTAEAACRGILTQPGNEHVDVEVRARGRGEAVLQILRGRHDPPDLGL